MKNRPIGRLIEGLLCLVLAFALIFVCAALSAEGQKPPESPIGTPTPAMAEGQESPNATPTPPESLLAMPTPAVTATPKPVTAVRVVEVEARPSVQWGALAILSLLCIAALFVTVWFVGRV